jgi:hypothetical protein
MKRKFHSREEFLDDARKRAAVWRKNNPHRIKGQQLWARFKLTQEDYDELVKQHNGLCAICRKSCISGKQLAVDHSHTSGEIRGLLCMNCNHGIGKFQDNPDLLRNAIKYLEKK